MRVLTVFGAAPIAMFSMSSFAQPPPAPPPPPCTAADRGFVCMGEQLGPEDLVALPGTEWVVASSMSGEGGLALVRTRDRVSTKAYPAAAAQEQLDREKYAQCPGPPSPGRFTTHGLYVAPGAGPVHRVLAVGHGDRESIEVFDIDTRGAEPRVTWVGCVIAPDPIGLNSVRGLPDGGFVTTNFLARGGDPEAAQRLREGERNGELWEWHPNGGWEKVPGSETSGANGIELSDDGETLYMAAWGSQSFIRLSRGAAEVKRDEVPLGFRVDNIHWGSDKTLIAVGQGVGADAGQWIAVKIDPETLAVREVLKRPDTAQFVAGTVAAEVGGDWWIGSFRGNRIAIVPAP